jgi:hypothetical protein
MQLREGDFVVCVTNERIPSLGCPDAKRYLTVGKVYKVQLPLGQQSVWVSSADGDRGFNPARFVKIHNQYPEGEV